MKATLHKTALILQLLAAGAIATVATNPNLIPAPYRPIAIIAIGAVQGILPSPVKREEAAPTEPTAE
jgi:hypothetical protein